MAARRALRDSDSSEESEEEEDGGDRDNESDAEAGDNPPPEAPAGTDSKEHQQEDADVDKASQPSEDMQARETARLAALDCCCDSTALWSGKHRRGEQCGSCPSGKRTLHGQWWRWMV